MRGGTKKTTPLVTFEKNKSIKVQIMNVCKRVYSKYLIRNYSIYIFGMSSTADCPLVRAFSSDYNIIISVFFFFFTVFVKGYP